jgi:hypothetical protein
LTVMAGRGSPTNYLPRTHPVRNVIIRFDGQSPSEVSPIMRRLCDQAEAVGAVARVRLVVERTSGNRRVGDLSEKLECSPGRDGFIRLTALPPTGAA